MCPSRAFCLRQNAQRAALRAAGQATSGKTSSAFRGWVRVRVLGYGFGVRGRKVKSRDCALASDLVRAVFAWVPQVVLLLRKSLLNLHNPVARAARALAGRYTV